MSDTPDVNKIAAELIFTATEQTLQRIGKGSRDVARRMLNAISNA